MTDTDLVTLLAAHAPPWLKLLISGLMTAWTLATAITAALKRVPDATFIAFEAAWPRLGHVARALRKLGTDVEAFRELAIAAQRTTPPPATPLGRRLTIEPTPPRDAPGFARELALGLLAGAVLIAIALGVFAGSGCAGTQHPRPWYESAQIALATSAHTVDGADAVIAARYTEQSADGGLDALEARYAPAIAARRAARATLLGAQVAIDAGHAANDAPARCRAALVLDAAHADLAHLGTVFEATGLPAPPDLEVSLGQVLDLTRVLAPSCGDHDAG